MSIDPRNDRIVHYELILNSFLNIDGVFNIRGAAGKLAASEQPVELCCGRKDIMDAFEALYHDTLVDLRPQSNDMAAGHGSTYEDKETDDMFSGFEDGYAVGFKKGLSTQLKRESVYRETIMRLFADTEAMTVHDALDALETHGYKIIRIEGGAS